jgi:hypothetical protein
MASKVMARLGQKSVEYLLTSSASSSADERDDVIDLLVSLLTNKVDAFEGNEKLAQVGRWS